MFAENVGVYRARVHAVVLAKQAPKARCVKHRTCPDNALWWTHRKRLRNIGEYIYRIGCNDQQGRRCVAVKFRQNRAKDSHVAPHQVKPSFARTLANASSNDDNLSFGQVGILTNPYPRWTCESLPVHQVESFAFGAALVLIEQDEVACRPLHKHSVCRSHADIAGAYHTYRSFLNRHGFATPSLSAFL